MSTGTEPIRVFYSYAREDQDLRETLEKHLRPLKRRRVITDWHDRLITAGSEWAKEIDEHLESADLILLLISPDFMASDYCHDVELKRAMARHDAGEARVVPVILRPARWQGFSFSKLQALPRDVRPVTLWRNQDEAFLDIVEGIERVAEELRRRPPPPVSQPAPVRPSLPAIQDIHGWAAAKVQDLQQQTARALNIAVVFSDPLKDGGQRPEMVVIPGGRFQMGSPPDEPERRENERQHEVEVEPFAVGKYAVTVEQFRRFIEAAGYRTEAETGDGAYYWDGSEWKKDPKKNWRQAGFEQDGAHPVVCVSWNDAMAYVEWLSGQTGQRYRLPTEAEWEYACRAGTVMPFYFESAISTDQANYDGNYTYGHGRKGVYRQKTVALGRFPANAWGLYDMHGNVWEWTCSGYDENYDGAELRCVDRETDGSRVLRGGSWLGGPGRLRAADRSWGPPDGRNNCRGFRLARSF